MATDFWRLVAGFFESPTVVNTARGLVVFLIGFALARFARGVFRRVARPRLSPQHALVVEKACYYALVLLSALIALDASGVDPSVLLGAAGILTLALGFASQTTVSNLISGLFLVGEQTFKIGDVIKVGTQTGVVTSIDLLSVKLRTFNNLLVRLPNESLLKSEITNLTHHPIRRLDLTLGVAYKENVDRVQEILMGVAESNLYCLDEPKPTFWFEGYGDSAILLRFCAWFSTPNYWEGTNRLQQQIFEALTANGIEIPFPHRSLFTGSTTEPLPIRVVEGPSPTPKADP